MIIFKFINQALSQNQVLARLNFIVKKFVKSFHAYILDESNFLNFYLLYTLIPRVFLILYLTLNFKG